MVVSEPTFVELSPSITEPKPVMHGVADAVKPYLHNDTSYKKSLEMIFMIRVKSVWQ